MTASALETRLRGALADPVSTTGLRKTLERLASTDASALAKFVRDPATRRTVRVDVTPLEGEGPRLALHPSYSADGMLVEVLIEDTDE